MDDQELRGRLDGLDEAVERVEEVARGLGDVLTQLRVGDAGARADVKIALSELRVAATALSDAAQSLQKSELNVIEKPAPKLSELDRWLLRIVVGLIGLGMLALGGKELFTKIVGL